MRTSLHVRDKEYGSAWRRALGTLQTSAASVTNCSSKMMRSNGKLRSVTAAESKLDATLITCRTSEANMFCVRIANFEASTDCELEDACKFSLGLCNKKLCKC